MKSPLRIILLFLSLTMLSGGVITSVAPGYAKKISLKLKAPKKSAGSDSSSSLIRIDSDSPENPLYSDSLLNLIVVAGYDKPSTSGRESFFISNHTSYTIHSIVFEIQYLDMAARQLDRREVTVSKTIPSGETTKFDISSWDTQRSFHYYLSTASKNRPSSPYQVNIRPKSLLLKAPNHK